MDDSMEMPIYQCHKKVRAAKITGFRQNGNPEMPDLLLGEIGAIVTVLPDWHAKHLPQVGGYYVMYDDGYTSYSPASAFESGYSKISKKDKEMNIIRPLNVDYKSSPAYNPGALVDALIERHKLKNDAALARALEVSPVVISKMRSKTLCVSEAILIRIHDNLGVSIDTARELMGVPRADRAPAEA